MSKHLKWWTAERTGLVGAIPCHHDCLRKDWQNLRGIWCPFSVCMWLNEEEAKVLLLSPFPYSGQVI